MFTPKVSRDFEYLNLAAGLILFVVGVIAGPYLTSWLGIGT